MRSAGGRALPLSFPAVEELVDAFDLVVEIATVILVKIAGAGALHPEVVRVHPLPHIGGNDFADDAGVFTGKSTFCQVSG